MKYDGHGTDGTVRYKRYNCTVGKGEWGGTNGTLSLRSVPLYRLRCGPSDTRTTVAEGY